MEVSKNEFRVNIIEDYSCEVGFSVLDKRIIK